MLVPSPVLLRWRINAYSNDLQQSLWSSVAKPFIKGQRLSLSVGRRKDSEEHSMIQKSYQFPKVLNHPSGRQMTLNEGFVLVQFDEAPDGSKMTSALRSVGFERVGAAHRQPDLLSKRTVGINETASRVWFQCGSTSLDAQTVVRLERALSRRVRWTAPVYSVTGDFAPESLVSPLPHVLLIRILGPEGDRAQNIRRRLAAMGLRHDANKSRFLGPFEYYEIGSSASTNAYELRQELLDAGMNLDIRYETMPMVKPFTADPDDPLFANQWNAVQVSAVNNAAGGWALSRGTTGVVVCILDDGCDLQHDDLRFASRGINLGTMTGDGGPTGDHGTPCAGIAAAAYNNNLGVAGMAGECRILPVAFENWTDAEVAAGINYAADNNVDVISMSFGQYDAGDGQGPSGWDFSLIDPAIENAFNEGVVLVAATGNEDLSTFNRYPARHPLVIAVGASDQVDNRKSPASPDDETWWGSNHADGVSVVAPGVRIPTTDRRGEAGYNENHGAAGDYTLTFNGTSAATPHVAGLAALIKSVCPTRSNTEVRNIIERTAAKVGSLAYTNQTGYPNGTRNQEMGYGRINVADATAEGFLYTVACMH